jgi:hypothetical protein
MNIKAKLEDKAGRWIRVHFSDNTHITGLLAEVGEDFVTLECYGQDQKPAHSQHLIPIHLIKFVTLQAGSFVDAERRRLEYLVRHATTNRDSINELER